MIVRNGDGAFRMRIVAKPRFKIPRAQRKRGATNVQDFCSRCPKLEECRDCAVTGRVLACESADELDGMGTRLSSPPMNKEPKP